MTNNQHGQVPEALRLANLCSNLTRYSMDAHLIAAELRRQHARIAELEAQIEALSGAQALSAAPAVPAGWKAVPVNPTPEMWKAAKTVPDPNPPYPPHYGLVWDAMLAATPTPPAEQQAEPGAVDRTGCTAGTDEECTRRGCATSCPAQQAAPEAAPTRTALPEGWTDCTIEFGNDGPEVVAYGPKRMMTRLAKWLGKYFAQVIADAATKAAPQQEAQEPVAWLNPWRADQVTTDYDAYGERGIPLYAAPQPAPAPLSEREAFEAWIEKDGGDLGTFGTPPNMHYRNSSVNNAWVAWKARAALAAQGGKDA